MRQTNKFITNKQTKKTFRTHQIIGTKIEDLMELMNGDTIVMDDNARAQFVNNCKNSFIICIEKREDESGYYDISLVFTDDECHGILLSTTKSETSAYSTLDGMFNTIQTKTTDAVNLIATDGLNMPADVVIGAKVSDYMSNPEFLAEYVLPNLKLDDADTAKTLVEEEIKRHSQDIKVICEDYAVEAVEENVGKVKITARDLGKLNHEIVVLRDEMKDIKDKLNTITTIASQGSKGSDDLTKSKLMKEDEFARQVNQVIARHEGIYKMNDEIEKLKETKGDDVMVAMDKIRNGVDQVTKRIDPRVTAMLNNVIARLFYDTYYDQRAKIKVPRAQKDKYLGGYENILFEINQRLSSIEQRLDALET